MAVTDIATRTCDLEAIGTDAHELPMLAAAPANDDTELRRAPYRILDQWRTPMAAIF